MRQYERKWALVSFAVAAAACGGSEAKPDGAAKVPVESTTVAAAPATAGPRVLIVGTSLTAGLGLDPDSAYPANLQRIADSSSYKVRIVAAGLSGETSAGALRRIDWLLKERYDVVVLETGANDGLRGLRVDSTKANIIAIVKKLRAANPDGHVLLAQMEAPPNLGGEYTRGFHDAFLAISREEGITLIPFFLDGVAGKRDLNQDDGIHPNAEGARKAARNMWKTLGPVLASVPGVIVR